MNPLLIFLLLFVGIPLLELYWLLEVGGTIGAFPTIFLVVFTAVLGGLMVRVQGFTSAMRVRAAFAQGETPAIEMLAGSLLLVSGFSTVTARFFYRYYRFSAADSAVAPVVGADPPAADEGAASAAAGWASAGEFTASAAGDRGGVPAGR